MASASARPTQDPTKTGRPTATLDYDGVKKLFYEKMFMVFKYDDSKSIRRFKKSQYCNTIMNLQTIAKKITDGLELTNDEKTLYNNYQLGEINDKTWLMRKKKYQYISVLKFIIPEEDYFDILIKIHIQVGHGKENLKIMQSRVAKKFEINMSLVDLIGQCCNICNKSDDVEKIETLSQRDLVFLDIISMEECPDGNFSYILLYVHNNSSFTLLRPLMGKCAIEISMEILKIFLDFGPPTEFEVPNNHYELFNDVVVHLKKVSSTYALPVTVNSRSDINYVTPVQVLRLIQQWIHETGSNNWALGCHVLQLKLNQKLNTKRESGVISNPYNDFFDCPQTIIVDDIDEFTDKNIVTEEELSPESLPSEQSELSSMDTDLSENDKNKTVTPTVNVNNLPNCNVCQCAIFNIYHCSDCKNPVHVFCCIRNENTSGGEFTFKCNNCCNK